MTENIQQNKNNSFDITTLFWRLSIMKLIDLAVWNVIAAFEQFPKWTCLMINKTVNKLSDENKLFRKVETEKKYG